MGNTSSNRVYSEIAIRQMEEKRSKPDSSHFTSHFYRDSRGRIPMRRW